MLADGIGAFLLAYPALFSIINPPGGAIIFNEVTAAHTHAQRVALARRVALYATFVMLGALLLGAYVLSFFGISLDALRIAGGIVVSARAYEMLSAPDSTRERKEKEAQPVATAENLAGFAFFPLTLPFTTGPGTIAVAISLGTARPEGLERAAIFYAGASAAVVAMAVTIWASYAMADRLAAVLGQTGRVAVARLAAFLLLGIGVQIALNGIIPVLHGALG